MASPPLKPTPHRTIEQESRGFISVDVETAGPNPSVYSLLSIGACTVLQPRSTFYIELQPDNDRYLPEAIAVHQLSLEHLAVHGLPPAAALGQFEAWLKEMVPGGVRPIFVAFNAPFDWMFVNDYFHRYLGRNPFGHNALDIKAFYMGLKGIPWQQTSLRDVSHHYLEQSGPSHHALQDAIDQADMFAKMLAELKARPPTP